MMRSIYIPNFHILFQKKNLILTGVYVYIDVCMCLWTREIARERVRKKTNAFRFKKQALNMILFVPKTVLL